jgi:CRP-like cAMP-binding protein
LCDFIARIATQLTRSARARSRAHLRFETYDRCGSTEALLIKSAEERAAGFLLEMADRVPSGGAVELPMSRQDIADYLGLTIETVSRTLKILEEAATIEVAKRRRILLRNRSALRRLNA